MPKYKLHELYTDEQMDMAKGAFREAIEGNIELYSDLNNDTYHEFNKEESSWSDKGVDLFDTAFIGPFTVNEYMKELGIEPKELGIHAQERVWKLVGLLPGVMKLEQRKDEKGLVTIDFSNDTKEIMEKDGKEELSLWDKICAFFGIQTEHARSLEVDRDAVEAIKGKQKEANDNFIKKQMKEKREEVLRKTGSDIAGVEMANEKADAWRKIFFPQETPENKVSDYTLDNGKKVSSLSLCMAVLQQTTKNDLSAMSPDEFKKRMAGDEKLQKRVEKIGNTIKDMAQKSNVKKLKYVDQMLGGDNGLSDLDDKLKKILKPGEKAKKLDISVATDYNNMEYHAEIDRDELFSTAAIMFKVKDDMSKIFGKDDEIYGMQNDKEVAKMEQHVKMRFKTAALRDAFKKENYDKALKIAGYGNDYSKLEEVADLAGKMGGQLHNELMHSKNKAENTFEDIEYDMGNEL